VEAREAVTIINKFIKIFLRFQTYCRSVSISEDIIENMRCHSVLIAKDLEKTFNYDERVSSLLKFFNDNQEIVMLNVDKSCDIAIISRAEYHKKMSLIFDDNVNFERLVKYDLEKDITAFNKQLKDNLGNNLSSKTKTYLSPKSELFHH
jgi:hypothetical protein